jgi:hypothetical protein
MVVMSEVMLRTLTVFSLFPGAGGASMLAGLMAWCGDDLRSTGVVGLGCRHLPTSPAVARSPVESFYVVDNVGCPVCGCCGAVSGSKKQAAGCLPLGCHGTQYNITIHITSRDMVPRNIATDAAMHGTDARDTFAPRQQQRAERGFQNTCPIESPP